MTKILVADDEEHNRLLLSTVLGRAGYQVIMAANGREAAEKLSEGPDMAVLDVNMPFMTGFEVCETIRKSPETQNMPVLILSIEAESEKQVKGYNLGADDYLPKPFNLDVLLARVKALERRILKKP